MPPIRPKSYVLTSREAEVLTWVARGKTSQEISIILKISKRTIDEHVRLAVSKTGAANRAHAVAIAVRDQFINL
jgi:LuxR family quorum sensing-dependent transcriptional regulator